MTIRLDKDVEQRLIRSIRRYFTEQMDDEIGDLKASLLLEFFLKEVGPAIYNRAVADAQALLHERVADLDGSCHEPEFGYWDQG